jgi:5-hydroxyisourate hydrolase
VTTVSTHVLDVERGISAAGVPVSLYRGRQQLSRASTNADGRISDLSHGSLDPGSYRIVFDVAAYFESHGRSVPFVQVVSLEFRIGEADSHYHVPLILSPYACTTYRGS